MAEKREIVGTVVFAHQGRVYERSPVYKGESPHGAAVYDRARRAMRILDYTKERYLPFCSRRFYPARTIVEVSNETTSA